MKAPSRFIIVDDDPTNNFICKASISNFFGKTDVVLFENPEKALDYINTEYQKSDTETMLFLDINMPGMTGWDFLEQFKKFSKQVREQFVIYMLTSSVDQRDKEKAEANAYTSGFLSKPLLENTLVKLFSE